MLRALSLCLLAAAAVPITEWKLHHPDAAQALAQWAHKDPAAARKLFAWDGLHPEQTKALVDWAISKPGADVVAFHTKHQDWPEFQDLLDKHRPALDDFAAWARQHRDAAKELMQQPRALEALGKDLVPAKSRQARAPR
jgi:D-alanyl-D-alanine dipeptidase